MVAPQEVAAAERIIQAHILRRYESQSAPGEAWRGLPEIPDKSEIMPKEDEKKDFFEEWDAYQNEPLYDINLPKNIIKAPWPSRDSYVGTHYQILREDSIAGLRTSVNSFKGEPNMVDDNFTHVYTDVHFKGFVLSQLGPAFHIEFSHARAGKQIRWQQSSRLQQGTMVALSPANDNFRSICKIAIVAARPLEGGLDQNPPQIDLFWGEVEDAVFDPVEAYTMLEARTGYFEASRHMLVALQKLRTEQFCLSKHLVELDQDIGVPDWLEERRLLNLTSLIHHEVDPITKEPMPIPAQGEMALYNADVLQGFPKIPSSGMDESQIRACERMITKKVSIVQGPPGTGKTFTSVSALRVMIENLDHDSPPIIISAQTNHALDQLLNHVLGFEPNVLRLGGRSDKGNVEILKRTLYVLRSSTTGVTNGYKGMKQARLAVENKQQEIQMTMAPIVTENILCVETLFKANIITEAQRESCMTMGKAGPTAKIREILKANPVPLNTVGLGSGNLIAIPRAPLVNFGLPVEESDLEYEQLQELEQEAEEFPEDKGVDVLRGTTITFGRLLTGRCPVPIEDRKIKRLLSSKKNLHDIHMGMRGHVYRYFEKQLNNVMLAKLKEQLREYKSCSDDLRIVQWVNNFRLIKHLGIKVIACTTTGLSKYRGLLASLQPRTLLIEEAAQTLEGTIMAGMFESLEQLILVGDHQQLQAHCNVNALEGEPYNLSTSMFERLVNNSIGYTMLNQQRRMIPEIRQLLTIESKTAKPFYKDLHDHHSVLDRRTNRPPVPGMGGKDTYFFHHNWPEEKTADLSRANIHEASMIAGFYNHLVLNGVEFSKITVLTYYNGQRKAILQKLKRHPNLGDNTYFNVFTVDSYQGEENDVIILSLVRSNNYMNIGFLDNKNRLVVALSRARRGLYIFGNSLLLMAPEMRLGDLEGHVRAQMWEPIINNLKDGARFDLDGGLPVTCSNHGKTIRIHDADQWVTLAGGCNQHCLGVLPCGHPCPLFCHPFDHSRVICGIVCTDILNCGHACSMPCGEDCFCLVAGCQKPEFGHDKTHSEISDVGATAWDSPTKADKILRKKTSQARLAAYAISHKQSIFSSQDIRKDCQGDNIHRDFSESALEHDYSTGNGFQKPGVNNSQQNFSSPSKAFISNYSPIKAWNTWDPQRADKEASDERRRIAAESSKIDLTTLVYKDVYRAVRIEDGVRVKDPSSSSTTIIPRVDVGSQARLKSAVNQAAPQISAAAASENPQKVMSENDAYILPTGLSKPLRTILSKQVDALTIGSPNRPPGTNEEEIALSKDFVPHQTIPRVSSMSITTPASLIDSGGEMSSSITDQFGSAEDFDQFEEQFG